MKASLNKPAGKLAWMAAFLSQQSCACANETERETAALEVSLRAH